MQILVCEGGVLRTKSTVEPAAASFTLGLAAWDELSPCGQWTRGAVHELVFDPTRHRPPKFPALAVARAAIGRSESSSYGESYGESHGESHGESRGGSRGGPHGGALVWCDPEGTLYPPALAAAGVPLDRVYLLRPKPADLNWTIAECLRCKGVGAVVAPVPARLSRVEARRMQLSAEKGGAVGILLRSLGRGSDIYAAATRWLVEPARGERTVQRWNVQLIHGHGGRLGQSILLEKRREADFDYLNDRRAAAVRTLVVRTDPSDTERAVSG